METLERLATLKWKVLLLVCLFGIMVLNNGINAPSFTYFLVNFVDELGSTSALVGLCHSLSFGVVAIFGPSVVKMVTMLGYKRTLLIGCFLSSAGLIVSSQATELWHIFLAHSFATGLGTCIVDLTLTYVIAEHFDECVSLYFGCQHAGSALGFIITPIICSYLRIFYGWRGALLMLGAVVLNSTILTLILFETLPKLLQRTRNKRESTEEGKMGNVQPDEKIPLDVVFEISDDQSTKHISKLRLFCKYPKLLMMSVQNCLCYLAYIGFFVHFSAGVISRGRSEEDAARLFAMFGCGSLAGRLGTFIPVRLGLLNEHDLYILSLMATGTEMFTFAWFDSLNIMLVVTFTLGVSLGGMVVLQPVVTRAFVPRDRFNEVWGIITIPRGISCIISGYIMGAIYDVTDSYNGAFFLASGCMFAMGLLMFCPKLVELCGRYRTNREVTITQRGNEADTL